MFFDSHAHYNDERFDKDRDLLLSTMKDEGVDYIMNASAEMSDIEPILALAKKYPFIYASVGVHPHEVESMNDSDIDYMKKVALENESVKAIGEIGLDYYYDNSPRDLQKIWFARQIELANEINLPVIIHDRDAHKDTMDILKANHAENVGGVLHCFAGSCEMAKEVLDLGMYIAFGGSITFKKSVRPVEVAKYVPIDRIVIETDCPYLTPEPHRGKRNHSGYLKFIAQRLADIKGVTLEEIGRITTENTKRCFRI